MQTFQHTVSARAGEGFNVHVTFADGTGGVFDFAPYLEHPCYEPLRDRAFFEKVQAAHGTLRMAGRDRHIPRSRMGGRGADVTPSPSR